MPLVIWVHVELAEQRQFGLMWNEEESRGCKIKRSQGNLVWQIDESSPVQTLGLTKEASASEESDRSQRGFVAVVTLIFSHPDTLLRLLLLLLSRALCLSTAASSSCV